MAVRFNNLHIPKPRSQVVGTHLWVLSRLAAMAISPQVDMAISQLEAMVEVRPRSSTTRHSNSIRTDNSTIRMATPDTRPRRMVAERRCWAM